MKLPCLSIRQPWAELILSPETRKNIENRTWNTGVRGTILIHASKGMTGDEFDSGMWFAHNDAGISLDVLKYILPDLPRGGIVGAARLTSVVPLDRLGGGRGYPSARAAERPHPQARSPWLMDGQFGFVLEQPTRLMLRPYKGALGFFQVELTAAEEDALRSVGLLGANEAHP
ncbi:MAG TPA: ASCH domain-containing protein [Polyangiaceae bacterium]|nr:ASCH domain-containing protein [Polyangiaceae bacterium]